MRGKKKVQRTEEKRQGPTIFSPNPREIRCAFATSESVDHHPRDLAGMRAKQDKVERIETRGGTDIF